MIGVECDVDSRSVARKVLVNRIVNDFPNTVVEGRPVVRVTKIHTWSFSYCFKAFENLDTGCTVIV